VLYKLVIATITHVFLKLLQQQTEYLRRIFTQNIDGIEALMAGGSLDQVFSGMPWTFFFRHLWTIVNKASSSKETLQVRGSLHGQTRYCLLVGRVAHSTDSIRFQQLVDKDVQECDLMLVMGTSLLHGHARGTNSLLGQARLSKKGLVASRVGGCLCLYY
jgi:NAD-dependent SIR2 family protein deacetylase